MAKCEELSKLMKPIYKLAEQIKGIKRLLDLFENAVNIWGAYLVLVMHINTKFDSL
jgi:hypothetical protein